MFRKGFLRVLCLLILHQILVVFCDLPMLGPADINFKKVVQCEDPEQYPSYIVIERRKVNRTFEIFNGNLNLDVDLDATVSVYINVEKWGDGGYKPNYLVMNETNACEILFRYAKNEVTTLMEAIDRQPKCPIMAGSTSAVNHSVDYTKLPQEVLYGDFKSRVILVKDGVPKMCFDVYVDITPKKFWIG